MQISIFCFTLFNVNEMPKGFYFVSWASLDHLNMPICYIPATNILVIEYLSKRWSIPLKTSALKSTCHMGTVTFGTPSTQCPFRARYNPPSTPGRFISKVVEEEVVTTLLCGSERLFQ